ncbi:hypothetical protein L596_020742 [Steinernema carpocapsae]|uniref:Granulins domain-containing protein n=1 Tax=Steinernema carpocapsae TaxID=34508 RepID=A0A4U5MV75_STECR|nr:hypothetical protein L596_020742 [Steinernema carpocapsae]
MRLQIFQPISCSKLLHSCPSGQTVCLRHLNFYCCSLRNAVCCPSDRKCCPTGFYSSVNEQFCIRCNLAGDEFRMPVATSSAFFEPTEYRFLSDFYI